MPDYANFDLPRIVLARMGVKTSIRFSIAGRMALAIGLIALIGIEVWISEPRIWFPDFHTAYYPAGVAVLKHQSMAELISKGVVGFVNLPIIAFLFAPLAMLPWKVAVSGPFLAAGLVAIAMAFLILTRVARLDRKGKLILLVMFALNGPLIYSVKLGNTSHFVLAALVGGLCLLHERRSFAAGTLLASAALIKLPLLGFIIYFAARRDWRGAAGFVCCLSVVVTLSFAIFPAALHLEWLNVAVLPFAKAGLASFNVQSIPSFLLRLRSDPPPLFDWGMTDLTLGESVATKVLQLTLVAACVWAWPNKVSPDTAAPATRDLQFMLILCMLVVTSPLSWSHYYCWLLIPAAFALGGGLWFGGSPLLQWTTVAAIAMTTPLVIFPHPADHFMQIGYTRLFVSSDLLGGLLMLFVVIVACRRASVISPAQRGAAV
jgi:alpha-1,2-mannosyltransferase